MRATAHEKDFFISYTQTDQEWAEWIAWVLEAAGYSTLIQAWDFQASGNFVMAMDSASKQATRTIAVLSPNYFESDFSKAEWAAAFKRDPSGERGILLPIRVRDCEVKGLLASIVYIDLVGRDWPTAKEVLLARVSRGRAKPLKEPVFPGAGVEEPAYPGASQPLWRVPHPQNRHFTGRDEELASLHMSLQAGDVVAVHALAGLGGVGKTQLALEYTYRHAQEYAGVWWFRADTSEQLGSDYVAFAQRLGLTPEQVEPSSAVASVHDWMSQQATLWLLVYDNAPDPLALKGYLVPSGAHQIVTSRHGGDWGSVARPLRVPQLPRAQSVHFLLDRTGEDAPTDADALAELLGDLPLALEQAGAYINAVGLSLTTYRSRFTKRRAALLQEKSAAADYPDSVATTWALSFDEVARTSPIGAALLKLVSFFAPDAIAPAWIQAGAAVLPVPLAALGEDVLLLDEGAAALRRHSLIEVFDERWTVHRLVQAVMRDRLGESASEWASAAVTLVGEQFEFDRNNPANWGATDALLPHALRAAALAAQRDVKLEVAGRLFNDAGLYLLDVRVQLDEALRHIQRALAIDERVYGEHHPKVATRANNVGQILYSQGDFEGALRYTERALAINEKVYGEDHPNAATNANNIGQILKAQGDLEGALRYTKRALAINEKVYGEDNPNVTTNANNIGEILLAQGDFEGALRYTERALAIDEKAYGEDNPSVAIDANNIGQILKAQGDLEGALRYTKRALAINEKVYGEDHPNVATNASNIGAILQAQGDLEGALRYTKRALAINESL